MARTGHCSHRPRTAARYGAWTSRKAARIWFCPGDFLRATLPWPAVYMKKGATCREGLPMKRVIAVIGIAMSAVSGHAASENFDHLTPGAAPPGWATGVTGRGDSRWTIEAEASAPSKPHVLKQSGVGDFPWAVRS